MKKKILAAILAVMMVLGALACAAAESATAPKIKTATYLNDGTIPTVTMEYSDPENRAWIEVYLLKEGDAQPNMGTIEVGGKTYSVVGIQTIDPDDPSAYSLLDDGTVSLKTDLYFGNCPVPEPGDDLFLTVGLTAEGSEEELGELIPITIPQSGEAFTNGPEAVE